MSATGQSVSQEDAEHHLDLLREIADDLLDRHAYFTLWTIRQWGYAGLSGDYFHWPHTGAVQDISFIEELVWVLHEEGHEIVEDAYAIHIDQACRRAMARLSAAEEEVLMEIASLDVYQEISRFQRRNMVQDALRGRMMNIARNSDVQGIRESWSAYGWAVETPENEEI